MELWCLQFHGMSVVEALEAIERKVGFGSLYLPFLYGLFIDRQEMPVARL